MRTTYQLQRDLMGDMGISLEDVEDYHKYLKEKSGKMPLSTASRMYELEKQAEINKKAAKDKQLQELEEVYEDALNACIAVDETDNWDKVEAAIKKLRDIARKAIEK